MQSAAEASQAREYRITFHRKRDQNNTALLMTLRIAVQLIHQSKRFGNREQNVATKLRTPFS